MKRIARRIWSEERAQDIAEYAIMLGVIAVLVLATVLAIGNNANAIFTTISNTLAGL